MVVRYRTGLVLTSVAFALLSSTGTAANAAHGAHRRHAQQQSIRADEIFSRRALHRARVILQLELLELRSERLERVRRALLQKIPIDRLLKGL